MLKSASARRMHALVTSDRLDDVRFVECLCNEAGDHEAIVVEILVPLGQKKTVADIRTVEPVAITFRTQASVPTAYPLREDFPTNVPHVNVAPEGFPRSLCLSDQPLEDQLRGYTAVGFLFQIRWWLDKTAYGELHGVEQPLDPLFHLSPVNVIASDQLNDAEYIMGVRFSSHEEAPLVFAPLSEKDYSQIIGQNGLMTPIFVNTESVPHGQLNWLPLNLDELVKVYEVVGVDLLPKLKSAVKALVSKPRKDALLAQPTALIVETEIKSPDGRSRIQKKAFVTRTTAGAIGEALGVLAYEGGAWAALIQVPDIAEGALSDIEIASADLHPHFSRSLAAAASGYEVAYEDPIVLAGAGAVGSHVAMNLARGGVGTWHIVDDDFLLPHNQARYALEPHNIGSAKSDVLCSVIRRLLESDDTAHPYLGRVDADNRPEGLTSTLHTAIAVIDATASVPAARHLSFDSDISGPVSSVFLNPAGSDAVVLAEPLDRSTRIDCVEMHYYWLISSDPTFANHLADAEQPLPVGGCRSPSVLVPETQVSLLSGLMAGRWLKDRGRETASISMWQGAASFEGISYTRVSVPRFTEVSVGDWTVKISDELIELANALRRKAAPKETGGIIAGSWDRLRNVVYLVGIYDAPPDSAYSETGFERGSVGVFKTIQELEQSTVGNLTYVGEWHSHPPGAVSTPSSDDKVLLRWIRDILADVEAPATMLIAGDDGVRIILTEADKVAQALLGSH